jgi:HTH-type transcriptional regulator/antitoxin HigA
LEEVRATAEVTNREEYARLLGDALPHVIHTDAENDRSTLVLEGLLRKKQRTAEEKRLAELLTLLIEDYEQQRYGLPRTAGPVDILRHLMDANGLRQVDLLDVFGAASVVSEVLGGKRELSKAHIARLSERFNISPALFF